MQRGLRGPRPPEDHPPAVPAPDGADPQVPLGPGLPLHLGEHRQPAGDVERPGASSESAATSGRKRQGRRTACWSIVPAGQVRQAQQVPRPERLELRPLGAQDVVQDPALGGQRSPHGPGGELGGRDPGAQQGAGDRPGGRPHDDVGGARVPAAVVLEHREHAGVVGLTDDPAGAQDEPDTAHVPPSCARDHPGGRAVRPAAGPAQEAAARRHPGPVAGASDPGCPGCGPQWLSAAPCPAADVPPAWIPRG